MRYSLVTSQLCFIYAEPGFNDGKNQSELTDDLLSGWAVGILETRDDGWSRIITHYGYSGWVWNGNLSEPTEGKISRPGDADYIRRIAISSADILSAPKVQGSILETLLRGSFVELLGEAEDATWSLIRSASGCEGYVPAEALRPRLDSDFFLSGCCFEISENGEVIQKETGEKSWFNVNAAKILEGTDEEILRANAVNTAKSYLGSHYRWGGKSPTGIDCSGLAFISWMEQGILIYRDAHTPEDYPVREISLEDVKPGDFIFFPGHVALALGGGRYIHATAYAKTPYVTINSLNPEDEDYRADLEGKITKCGSLFAPHT